ncbi:MAG: transcriptional regulator [Actinomycetaceae bacterium]|nr:transcriptional regulator [Actinomycetaceae bacterium]
MISDSEYLKSYIPLVEFLGKALGPKTEVVLHDVANLESSVIAIANGQITRRKVGDPATDMMLRTIKDKSYRNSDYVVGYSAKIWNESQKLSSATYYIKRDDRLIGMLCFNTDNTEMDQLIAAVERFSSAHLPKDDKPGEPANPEEENIVPSLKGMAREAIEMTCAEFGVTADQLEVAERIEVVRLLNSRGYFQLKGAVHELAPELGVSEPTVYRYLETVKKSDEA